jgi:Derlin-1
MSDFSSWYNTIPRFTKYWLSATVGISLGAKLGILPPGQLFFDISLVFQKFQVSDELIDSL